jgi:hypothetical protein
MDAELKANYPLITDLNGTMRMEQTIVGFRELNKKANQIITTDDEVAYLKSLEDFIDDVANKKKKEIKNKLDAIERSKKFDMINFIKYLPYDMVYTIKKYLEPELTYTRKITTLVNRVWNDLTLSPSPYGIEGYLFKVSKPQIIRLIGDCYIYPTMSMRSGDKKERWCNMIYEEFKLLIRYKLNTPINKLLALRDEEWSSDPNLKRIDKWYKFFLYIHTFKKYRAELETAVIKQKATLTKIKNNQIICKK